jgi:hypothetical protein
VEDGAWGNAGVQAILHEIDIHTQQIDIQIEVRLQGRGIPISDGPLAAVGAVESYGALAHGETVFMLQLLSLATTSACSPMKSIGCIPQLVSLPVGREVVGRRAAQSFTATRISERPTAFVLRNFLSEQECEAIRAEALASGRMHAAETAGNSDARKLCELCTLSLRSRTVGALTEEAAHLFLGPEVLNSNGAGCEDMHVLKYSPGGEYAVHYDGSPTLPRIMTICVSAGLRVTPSPHPVPVPALHPD